MEKIKNVLLQLSSNGHRMTGEIGGGYRVGRIIIVMLLWSEIMGGYNTPDTTVEIGAQK